MAFVWLMSFLERQRKRNGDRLPIGARRPRRRSLEANELWVQDDRLPYGHIMDVFALFPTRKINNRQEPPASGTSNPFAFVCRANANRSLSDPHTHTHTKGDKQTPLRVGSMGTRKLGYHSLLGYEKASSNIRRNDGDRLGCLRWFHVPCTCICTFTISQRAAQKRLQ